MYSWRVRDSAAQSPVPYLQSDLLLFETIGFADAHRGWAVGKKGLILKFEGTVPGGVAPSLKK